MNHYHLSIEIIDILMQHAITIITVDLPVVISTDVAAILDPHKRHTGLDRRGWDGDLNEFLSYDGHASCFHGIFGLTRATRNYNATLFRFALRRHSSNSKIVKTEYSVERVRGFLYDSFIKEAPIIMLFLKYVQQISLYDNDQLVYKVSLEPSQMYAIKHEREALIKLVESGFHTCSLRVYSMTIITEDDQLGQTPTQSYHWLVMNMIGSTDHDILQLSHELEILPWVGMATPLPRMATISNLALPFCNTSNITSCVQQLQPGLRKVAMSLPWCEEAQGHSEGHVFCFLPLPNTTHLPINIHGYFAVSDNRRSIEWPASDNKSQKALWNKALLEKHVAPLYSILLACRTQLVKYAGTPLPVLGSEGKITDPYAAWPLISRVRYQPIWNELVKPALHGAINVPLLWSPANNGRWVCLNEAYYLPVSPTFPLGEVAIEVLIRANMPVVSLPNDVRETLVECGQHLTMSQRSVQPTLVRQALRMMPPLSFNDKDSLQSLLECVLYDITQYNYNELVNLKLLPLNTSNFRVEVFKQKACTNEECVFVSDYQSNNVLKFLPGVESQIMDTSLCLSVQSKMVELAQRQVLQLRILSPQVISSYLLPKSIKSWCPSYRLHQPITWCPGRNGHPSGEWISDVWTWLSRHQTTLPSVVGLPVVPQQLLNSTINSNVTLLPLPVAYSGSYFVEKDGEETLLANLLRKMHATVISYNISIFSHPSISQYILQINIHTVLQYINNAGISVISSLNNDEKSYLRVLVAQYYYSSRAISFDELISQLPIFEVGIGANPVQLVSLHFRSYVLPETHIEFDPSLRYPPNILSNKEPVVVKLINKLGYGCQNNETLFISSILPFALKQCKASSCWSNGDELIVWMLNKMNSPPKSLLKVLQSEPFIRTKANPAVYKTASQLYNIKDEQFERLYDSSVDPVFPDDIYWKKDVMSKLMRLGIVSWSSLMNDPPSLVSFMKERAESVQLLRGDAAIQRSCYILELIATNPRLIDVLMSELQSVRFLAVERSPPEDYPSFLQWAGAGKKGSFDAPCNICHHNTNLYIIGSVLPVLSSYYIRNQVVCPPKVHGYFYSPSIEDVIKQFQILVNSVTRPITNVSEADKVSQLIHNIYSYLNTHYSEVNPSTLPTKWIWWPNEQGHYMFMPTSSFVWRSPLPLNPLVHTVSSDLKLSVYGNLFARAGMRKTLSLPEIVDTLRAISLKFPIGQLPDCYLKMAIKIVKYLEENKYESSGDVLLPTTENRLCPAKDCTYDDREWIKQRVGAGVRKYRFVHGEIPPITARYFGVKPLSKRIAPSEKLKLTYTKAGQKERVTQRISGIVKDYSGNIDVFKELIQNADDAGATEIKLLLDWRTHGKEYLFEQEMEHWQGPAVVAYNNATFSDQDFDNICELAAETKMKDPMKTGRFGVGFCASYSLTDVPSFVSRHFITIFDPHTKYLGDRVSHNEPGIRINLVEEKEGLAVFEDHFSPFNGLFGCNIFQLSGGGFNGTIFRFPLRMSGFPRSEISNEHYDRYAIEKLMKDLQKEASSLLLFLKHITSLEVLILEEGVKSPKEMKVQFHIQKESSDHQLRIQLMRNPHLNQKPVCSTCSIKVVDNVNCKDHMCQYLIGSALSTTTEAKPGLVPVAELAISVSNDCPQSLENDGHLFCFLPLPLGSYLPFHVNGFFDVGKDRRGLKEAQNSPEYEWNRSLIQNSLPLALEHALSTLCKQMNLLNNDAKEACLKQYYSLWPGEFTATTGTGRQNWITQVFSQSVKQVLSNSNEKLVWSEINGGKWVSPQSAFLFIGDYYLPEEIRREAIQLLLSHSYSIVKCPHHIHQLLKASLNKTCLFNYERFFKEIFLPNISTIDVSIRNKHLLFVLTKLYEENNSLWKNFNWAIQPLKSTSCIPVDISGQLVRPEELIDTRYTPIAKLYDPEEGRFPDQNYQKTGVMSILTKMGMITGELPIEELTNRAQIVDVIGANDETKAIEKMISLLEYIDYIEKQSVQSRFLKPSTKVIDKRKERITALANVPFLRAASKPAEISIPWCTTEESFLMPLQLLSPQHFALVFSKRPLFDLPVTDNSIEVEKVVEYLGIDDNKPTVDDVLDHLCCLIEHFNDQMLDEKTIEFLEKEKIFPSIYEFLQSQTDKEAIKSRLSSMNCIWQNGMLLSPKQVLHSWEDKQYYPYLCSLSDSNLKYAEFFEVVGVMREATLEHLLGVLNSIKEVYQEQALPDKLLEFVIAVSKHISRKISSNSESTVLIPDQMGVLRLSSEMTCDGNLEERIANLPVFDKSKLKKSYSVHESIPRKLAIELGAYPILEHLIKDLEDEMFLDGIDYGPHEEIVDRLNGILKKYPADMSIFREFIQNADDAQATEIVFVLDHRVNHPDSSLLSDAPEWKKLQSKPALCIYNNRPFSEEDVEGISRLGRGGKGDTPNTIGQFGIGFNVAYHLTDCPSFVSYDSQGSPKDYCILDPLRKYCPNVSKHKNNKPGRRWKNKEQRLEQMSDQFEPYLNNCFSKFKSIVPSCIADQTQGYSVFRLPLIRWRPPFYETTSLWLKEGRAHNSLAVQRLIKVFKDSSENMLFFLKKLKHISVFEIMSDDNCIHHFTTDASITTDSPSITTETRGFTSSFHFLTLNHQVMSKQKKKEVFEHSNSQWLINNRLGFPVEQISHILRIYEAAKERGLKAFGGTAIRVDGPTKGSLFCSLPMNISSCLPVHLNGEFLVNDARNHLSKLPGLEEWNATITEFIIVPSYVDLILRARSEFDGSQKKTDWFYSLFPDITTTNQEITEASELKVGHSLYEQLLTGNQPILIDARYDDSVNWLRPNAGFFCVSYSCKTSEGQVHTIQGSESLKEVLLSLGMPITNTPDYIFLCFCAVSDHASVGLVTPEKVIQFLKELDLEEKQNEEIIKKNIELLLQFCIQNCSYENLVSVLRGTPILLTQANTLSTQTLFSSQFSHLLPHCLDKFIHPSLENSKLVGKQLKEGEAITALPLYYVCSHIQLSDVYEPTKLSDSEVKLVQSLWKYFMLFISVIRSHHITNYFLNKPIIPSSSGNFYPPKLGKCLFLKTNDFEVMLSVVRKLGYKELDCSLVELSEPPYVMCDLISRPSNCSDVITCMQLYPPTIQPSLSFTAHEATKFISLLNEANIPHNLISILKKLPVFQTVDDSYITISSGCHVYIKPNDVPCDGIINIKGTNEIILKVPDSMTEQFYKKVLSEQEYQSARVTGPEFYIKFIIPNLDSLNDDELLAHMEHVCFQWQRYGREWNDVLIILKSIPFICKQGERQKACSLYDPDVKFHATFHTSELPPEEWCKETQLKFLRELGLQRHVDYSIWLSNAMKVSEEAIKLQRSQQTSDNLDNLIIKSETLTSLLSEFIAHAQEEIDYKNPKVQLDNKFTRFLFEASKIQFIYCPAPCELDRLLKIMTGMSCQNFCHFVQFREAVYHSSANLAGLFLTILPKSCEFLKESDPVFSQLLFLREPINIKTVTQNLIKLSKALSQTTAQVLLPTNETSAAILKLKVMFEEHYKFLEENLRNNNKIVKQLKHERCILLSPDHFSFLLVQPNQLILHIPQEYNFSPFCYSAPPELLKYGKLLKALGIQQDITPQHCIKILANIKGEMERADKKLSDDRHFLKVCESAYKCLIESLRSLPEQPQFSHGLTIYLPSVSLELIESSQLVYNDVPWIATRLQKSQQLNCKFLFPPPPDKNGQKIPPPSLQVKLISEQAIEKLHSVVKSKLNRCIDQELYETKKHCTNCNVVQALEDTFKSQEFKFGMSRLFWHKIQKHPNTDKAFRLQMQAMNHLKIFCVKEIKTVIHFDKKELPATEDNSRLCYLIKEGTKLQLYITHKASHFREDVFFEEVAMELNEYFDHRVGDAVNIKAILQCCPSHISLILDKRAISPFDPKTKSLAETITDQEIGSELPLVEKAFQPEDLLIMCNYSQGETVIYHSLGQEGQPVFQYAKIMECPIRIKTEDDEPTVEYPTVLLDNRCVKLQIGFKENNEPVIIDASLLQVYKLLTTSQRTTLSSGQSSSFATPLILASLPVIEEEIYKWSEETFDYNKRFSCCSLSVLCLRITAHLHYILETREVSSDLFLTVVKELVKIIKSKDITSHKKKTIKDVNNLVQVLTKQSIEDHQETRRELKPISTPRPASPVTSIPGPIPINDSTSVNVRLNSRFPRLPPPQLHADNAQAEVPPQPKISIKDAEMWLQQAKADYLAAQDLYMCQCLKDTLHVRVRNVAEEQKQEQESDREEEEEEEEEKDNGEKEDVVVKEESDEEIEKEEEENEEEEEEVHKKPDTQTPCKFPALVCFLSHDVVEKCIKGIMYAKCGLPTNLLESSHLSTLCEQLERSGHCTSQLKNVVKECVLQVNEHSNKSRYPNYQVPPCAPASIYTSLEAEEALRAAHRLIQEIKKDDELDGIIGDLENLPEQRFSSLLSAISVKEGKEIVSNVFESVYVHFDLVIHFNSFAILTISTIYMLGSLAVVMDHMCYDMSINLYCFILLLYITFK